MSLSVSVLGSAAMFATPQRAASGYLVELDGFRLWLDAGPGTWRNLLGILDYTELDGVLLSHRHPDHTTDVFEAYHARSFGGPEPLDPIPLWAPAETIDRVNGFCPEAAEAFELRPVAAGDVIMIDRATVALTEMVHPPETVGARIELDGAVLAYSADSGPEADFQRLAGDADVFLCEATLQDSDPAWEGHLRASQAARIATAASARRLVLTHLPFRRDPEVSLREAEKESAGVEVSLAADGARIEVSA